MALWPPKMIQGVMLRSTLCRSLSSLSMERCDESDDNDDDMMRCDESDNDVRYDDGDDYQYCPYSTAHQLYCSEPFRKSCSVLIPTVVQWVINIIIIIIIITITNTIIEHHHYHHQDAPIMWIMPTS